MLTRFPLYNVSGSSSAFWHGEIDSGSCLEADTARPPTGRLRTCSCPPCQAATTATPGDYVFCLPSLVIIGMAKAGTEEMRGWLSSHPAMRVTTERETQFFNQLFGAAGGVPQRQQGRGKRAGGRALAEESPAAVQARVIADLASAWPRYASLFPVLRSEVGRVLTFEKSAGYTHTRRKGAKASGLVDVVPTLAHRLMPSARFVLIARDPATLPRSRYQQCLRQMHRHARAGELMTQKCGGSVDADFEQMVLRSGVVQADGSGVLSPAPLASGPGGASPLARLLAARMGGPSGLLLVEDAVETLLAWGSALREGRLLVLFTEQFGSDPFGMMNQVLRHVGLPSYNWPDAVRVPNSTRWTYCLATSKSVAPKRKLSAAWEAALRLAYTPVIRRFKEALPCLHAPWREAAGEHAGEAADNKETGAHEELRRKMCP